jgi:hypothetical protein
VLSRIEPSSDNTYQRNRVWDENLHVSAKPQFIIFGRSSRRMMDVGK